MYKSQRHGKKVLWLPSFQLPMSLAIISTVEPDLSPNFFRYSNSPASHVLSSRISKTSTETSFLFPSNSLFLCLTFSFKILRNLFSSSLSALSYIFCFCSFLLFAFSLSAGSGDERSSRCTGVCFMMGGVVKSSRCAPSLSLLSSSSCISPVMFDCSSILAVAVVSARIKTNAHVALVTVEMPLSVGDVIVAVRKLVRSGEMNMTGSAICGG
jgi:hypothetical protein